MSVEAMTWAKRQVTGSAGAKAVLRSIGDYADEDGVCWPSRRQLAIDCEMSVDTVSRHMASLEAAGFIEREARARENGSRTSDRIQMLFNRPSSPAEGTPPPQFAEGPPPQITEAPSAIYGGPLCKNGETRTITELTLEDSPHSPPEGGGAGQGNLSHEGKGASEPDTQFAVFYARFGADPAASEAAALRAWARLTGVERAEALAGLPAYLDHCDRAKRRRCDPATYLRDRRWRSFAALPVATVKPAAERTPEDPVRRAVLWAINGQDRSGWHFVIEGSEAWCAWRAAYVAAGRGHVFAVGRHEFVAGPDGVIVRSAERGRTFPLPFPPLPPAQAPPVAGRTEGAVGASGG